MNNIENSEVQRFIQNNQDDPNFAKLIEVLTGLAHPNMGQASIFKSNDLKH